MKKNKIIKLVCWIIIICLIIVIFIEMFICRNISKSIKFIELNNYQNRSDLLTFVNIIVASIISYNVYNLSKRINEQNNIEKERNKYESVCIVYDYLNEVILHTKKVVFNDKEDYHKLEYKENFMKHAYNISKNILDESDMELIRNIDKNLRTYINIDPDETIKKMTIKWLYKSIFDVSFKIKQVEELNNITDIDIILNPQLVLILAKLRKKMGYSYCKSVDYKIINLKIKNVGDKIIVNKKYNEDTYINDGKGLVEIHEPVFYAKRELYDNGGMIYKGEIKNYLPNGKGEYYYYKSNILKGISINSYDLVDKTAERIKKILQKEDLSEKVNLTVKGQFKDGKIIKGIIEFEDKNIDSIEVTENDYIR